MSTSLPSASSAHATGVAPLETREHNASCISAMPVFQIQLQPSGRNFNCGAGQNVLDAAQQAGIALPYQCKTGDCGSCVAQVQDGVWEHQSSDDSKNLYGGMQPSKTSTTPGTALLCCAQPRSNLTLQCRELNAQRPIVKMTARVAAMTTLASDVMQLQLALPAGKSLAFRAGQYVDILFSKDVRRSYSLASAPRNDGTLELHIRHRPGGVFTGHVFDRLRPKDVLRLEGPFGAMFPETQRAPRNANASARLNESDAPDEIRAGNACGTGGVSPIQPASPLLILATGTGMAPVKALLESAIAGGQPRPMRLYWGGRTQQDLYLHTQCLQWAQEHDWFDYIAVLSRADETWSGRRGHVHEAALADHPQLQECEVYACGSPAMVSSAQTQMMQQGLPREAFYADAFHPATG